MTVRSQVVAGIEHRHVLLWATRDSGPAVVGVINLHPHEWREFERICDLCGIEITHETVPPASV